MPRQRRGAVTVPYAEICRQRGRLFCADEKHSRDLRRFRRGTACSAACARAGGRPAAPAPAAKRRCASRYSDWPGWTAFEIGIQKGWFKEAGVDVKFDWFEYAPSMEAFAAGKVDAVMMTIGDALVTGAPGARSVAILVTDYSNGNDMIVAKPGIKDLKALKGKKVGLEVGLVEHLLLLKALREDRHEADRRQAGQRPDPPDARRRWRRAASTRSAPGSRTPGQALKAVAGSKAIFTSADVPGLIYDLVCVNPQSLAQRRDDWVKVVKVWYRIVDFVRDPANQAEAVKIMAGARRRAARGVREVPAGHALPDARGGADALREEGHASTRCYGCGKVADDFNVANKVYAQAAAGRRRTSTGRCRRRRSRSSGRAASAAK